MLTKAAAVSQSPATEKSHLFIVIHGRQFTSILMSGLLPRDLMLDWIIRLFNLISFKKKKNEAVTLRKNLILTGTVRATPQHAKMSRKSNRPRRAV